jgi:hypothetical protein
VSPEQRQGLEQLRASSDIAVARRASVLLHLIENGDVIAAAREHNVTPKSLRIWKNAFERRGVAGLLRPEGPRIARRLLEQPVFPVQLPIHVRLTPARERSSFAGETTMIGRRCITVVFNESESGQSDLTGVRVIADIDWPTTGPGRRTLHIRATVTHSDRGTIRLTLRRYEFRGMQHDGLPEGPR